MKNLLTVTDLSKEIIEHIFELSEKYYHPTNQLQGKNIVFAFEKPSLRTKIATEVAISQLGWHVIHIEPQVFYGWKVFSVEDEKKLNEWREALKDTVKNINEWCDALFARVFSHQTLLDIDSYSDLKIVNALCDKHHPMQALADLYTIREIYGTAKVTVAFVGDSNNVAFSLAEILLKFGHEVRIASPEAYSFKSKRREHLQKLAKQNNSEIIFTDNPQIAVSGADCVYTDTFISMWEERLYEEKSGYFSSYQVNKHLMSITGKESHFMHCLPAHRGEEVVDEVIDGKNSLVYRQARNRMVVSRGVFLTLFDI
jgi:ornithine carbamoyltransferase